MLRKVGTQEWIFDECKKINAMLFRFKDKESPMGYATSLANNLREYPIEEVLSGPWLIEDWNPDLIKDVLDRLIPKNVYVTAVAKIFEPLTTKEEKWYGTKCFTQKIAEDKINAWSSAPMHERLH